MSKITKKTNLNEVKKPKEKLSPEQEKRNLYSSIQDFVAVQGQDETFDKQNEKFNLFLYRKNNEKTNDLIGVAKVWNIRFTDDFYNELRRVLRMPVANGKPHIRPRIFAKITNDLIYLRFPKGTLTELQRRNPVTVDGNRLLKHFQLLTDLGDAHLKQFIKDVVEVIEKCDNYPQFYQRLRKKLGKSWQMSLFENGEG